MSACGGVSLGTRLLSSGRRQGIHIHTNAWQSPVSSVFHSGASLLHPLSRARLPRPADCTLANPWQAVGLAGPGNQKGRPGSPQAAFTRRALECCLRSLLRVGAADADGAAEAGPTQGLFRRILGSHAPTRRLRRRGRCRMDFVAEWMEVHGSFLGLNGTYLGRVVKHIVSKKMTGPPADPPSLRRSRRKSNGYVDEFRSRHCHPGPVRQGSQNSAWPGLRGNGMTSRMFVIPVAYWIVRSNPRPNPAWGTLPYRRRSRYQP